MPKIIREKPLCYQYKSKKGRMYKKNGIPETHTVGIITPEIFKKRKKKTRRI